nr:hypothetical protein KPHV_29860 [Kitasatospora purpeofusca]
MPHDSPPVSTIVSAMTQIELERITARSYVSAPGRVTSVPLADATLTSPQSDEERVWSERADNVLAMLREDVTPLLLTSHAESNGDSRTTTVVSAVHLAFDLVTVNEHMSLITKMLDIARRTPCLLRDLQQLALDNSSPAAGGSSTVELWQAQVNAWTYSSALHLLHSAYGLAVTLDARGTPLPAEAVPGPRSGAEGLPEPLAIACGITRLREPLIPRAPGRVGAAGRSGVGACGLDVSLAA